MVGPSKVIVLDPDPRAGRQVQLGFEREGIAAQSVPALPAEISQLSLPPGAGLVMVGGDATTGLPLVRRVRELLTGASVDIPVVFTGRGLSRADLELAGADEIVGRQVYLRDLVTIGRILRDVPSAHRDRLVGNLAETTGVYTLVRALSALGRSAVLTLTRGLRRGEVRFYRGEVTSASVGLIHGQAALHQLLLWTDARFDFSHEDVVRRQQIPLAPDELFADADRFLQDIHEAAGALSPSSVLEPDARRVTEIGKQIPTEVHGVLRMFDGHRVLTDILEDSPYRVFETLRVAQKAVEAGLLKVVDSQRPKASWKAVLAIDEWLVGSDTRDAVVERTASIDTAPAPKLKPKGKRRSKKQIAVDSAPQDPTIDWGELVPRTIGADVGPLSPVVPSQVAQGEMQSPTRDRQRERLESLMDTDKRDRIFPSEIGVEPSIVVAPDDEPEEDWEKVRAEAKKRAEATDAAGATNATNATNAADAAVAKSTDDTETKSGSRRKKKAEGSGKTKRGRTATPVAGVRTKTPPAGVRVKPPAAGVRIKTPPAGVPVIDDDGEDSDAWQKMRAEADARAAADAKAAADTNPVTDPKSAGKTSTAAKAPAAKSAADEDPTAAANGFLDANAAAGAKAAAQANATTTAAAAADDTETKTTTFERPSLDDTLEVPLDASDDANAPTTAKAAPDGSSTDAKTTTFERVSIDDAPAAASVAATLAAPVAAATVPPSSGSSPSGPPSMAPSDASDRTRSQTDAKAFAGAALTRLAAEGKAKSEETRAKATSKADAEAAARTRAMAVLARLGAEGAIAEARARNTPPSDVMADAAKHITSSTTPPEGVATTKTDPGLAATPPVGVPTGARPPTTTTPPTGIAATAAATESPRNSSSTSPRPASTTSPPQTGVSSTTSTTTGAPTASTRPASTTTPPPPVAAAPPAAFTRSRTPTGAPITTGLPGRARSTTGAPRSADPNALQFAKVAGEALARADAKVQEAAQRSAAAEEAKAYAARVKAAAAAKRLQESGGSAPGLVASGDGGEAATAAPADRKSLDAQGLVRQIVSEGGTASEVGALGANALVGVVSGPAPRPRLLDDTEGFEPVDLSNADANIGGEHVVVRPSVAALQDVAAAVIGAGASSPSSGGIAIPLASVTAVTQPSASAAVPVAGASGTTQPIGSAQIIGSMRDVSQAVTAPVRGVDEAVTAPFLRTEPGEIRSHVGEAITTSESPAVTVAVADVVTVKSAADTAIVTAAPRMMITENATPIPTEDEPSDGIIRAAIVAPDSAELARSLRIKPPGGPEHDGPPVKETTGEIGSRPRRDTRDPDASEPSMVVADVGAVQTDLAAVHAAIAAVATPASPPPATVDAASAPRELEVSNTRRDAVAFSDVEEAFFKTAESHTHSAPKFESFDDLDEGYEPPKFWDRVFGKKKKKP